MSDTTKTFPPVSELLANPTKYAWNSILRHVQFTQEQLLSVKDHLDLVAMVKFQKCITTQFLRTHFQKDIDNCLELDWNWIHAYLTGKLVPIQYSDDTLINNYLNHPEHFAWNELLYRVQFTPDQLLSVRNYLDIPSLVKYQKCVTLEWLETHFMNEINECIDVDWAQIEARLTAHNK